MNVHDMTIEQLMDVEITSAEQGRQLANDILQEQLAINREMVGLYDNTKWQALSGGHYELRKCRIAILMLTGKTAIEQKRITQR